MERVVVMNGIVIDAGRGFAGHNNLRVCVHHALVNLLHLVEGRWSGCEIVVWSIAAVVDCVGA